MASHPSLYSSPDQKALSVIERSVRNLIILLEINRNDRRVLERPLIERPKIAYKALRYEKTIGCLAIKRTVATWYSSA